MNGIPAAEAGHFLGGPEAGRLIRVAPHLDVLVVREEREIAAFTDYRLAEPAPRQGIYRRIGRSTNWKWEGWSK